MVTGGAGFIGSHLCEALVARGDHVVVVDDLSTSSGANLDRLRGNAGFELVTGSVLDRELLDRVAARCDWTAHLAAAVGVRLIMAEPLRSLRTIVQGTESVLSAAHRHGHRKVLFASTSEIYGDNPETLNEDARRILGPTTVARWSYGTAKAVDEFLAFAYHAERSLPVVVARLFNTVGPRQSAAYGMVLPRFVDQALLGEDLTVYGDGTQTRCFCHVSDAVPALLGLADHPGAVGLPFNVGSTEEISILDLARRVINLTGSSSRIRHVDFQQAHPLAFADIARRRPDTGRVRALLGWQPRLPLDAVIGAVAEDRRNRLASQHR